MKRLNYMGGQKIELLYLGKAHTDGDILVYFPQEKAIHMGNVLYWPGKEEEKLKTQDILNYAAQHDKEEIKGIIQSWGKEVKILEKVLEMDFEKVIPGHGKLTDKKGIIDHIAYSITLLTEVKKLIK